MTKSPWIIQFVLEKDIEEDREEIEDIEREFDRMINDVEHDSFVSEVVVTAEPLVRPAYPWIPVFMRKERL